VQTYLKSTTERSLLELAFNTPSNLLRKEYLIGKELLLITEKKEMILEKLLEKKAVAYIRGNYLLYD